MNLASICRRVYRRITGYDTKEAVRIQQEIISNQGKELGALNKRVNNKERDIQILQGRIDELHKIRVQLERELTAERNKPDAVVYESKFVMTQKVYHDFVKSMEPPVVTNNTTAQGAGYLVGMQRVLEKLREQFVVGN